MKRRILKALWVLVLGKYQKPPFCYRCSAFVGCHHDLHYCKDYETQVWRGFCYDCMQKNDEKWRWFHDKALANPPNGIRGCRCTSSGLHDHDCPVWLKPMNH